MCAIPSLLLFLKSSLWLSSSFFHKSFQILNEIILLENQKCAIVYDLKIYERSSSQDQTIWLLCFQIKQKRARWDLANKGYLKNRRLARNIIYANICFNFLLYISVKCKLFYSIFIASPYTFPRSREKCFVSPVGICQIGKRVLVATIQIFNIVFGPAKENTLLSLSFHTNKLDV